MTIAFGFSPYRRRMANKRPLWCFWLFLLSVILAFTGIPLSARATSPSLSAASAILYEPSSRTFLCELDADTRRPMASTTKIMTALVAIENSALDDVVEVSPEASGIEGSSVYLQAGERVSMETLLYALLLQSANDAAAAIAVAVGGSIEGFADMMNERARTLGLTDTHFTNPHGLHDKEHYTTARELALIAAEAMQNETFRTIASTKKKTLSLRDGTVSRVVYNHNRMLSMYKGVVGVKTGFTKNSGRCLVGAAERDGVLLISVTLNAPNDWRDHQMLFEKGFSAFTHETLVEKNEYTVTLPIENGRKKEITLTNSSELALTLPIGTQTELFAELPDSSLQAPIKKGAHLGTLHALYNGKTVASVPLIATETVEKPKKKNGWLHFLFD